ncbi:uncharacterized protein MYCFIDRAFT_172227 [Pseudocercospora fijiensis CIRAD86]|uniref:Enolase C-terminal domain-containing protein n=1 Tax=Pseudocercospora fijiensis (strain CIRAD86) TaxID=383855 RepID=M3BAZ9_PSEFD|nr:uncharacterized protein MYCFIDRAFT_172227 [Pseudocercospora fijiensis CIRAD86]EME86482.1 hypothetical protein MYCFIDRAFT_172227 [Pseudocercospora fijiensis CIRAD86]
MFCLFYGLTNSVEILHLMRHRRLCSLHIFVQEVGRMQQWWSRCHAGGDFHGRVHKAMAKQLAKLLEPERLLFIEEPLLSESVEGMQELESGCTLDGMSSRFWEDRSVDILQPDICHCGGISETFRIAKMAEAYDIALAPHCPLGPIALAANAAREGSDLTSYTMNAEVWNVQDGMIELMTGPGLGIEMDEEAERAAAVDAKAWRSPHFVGPGGEIRECAHISLAPMIDLVQQVLLHGAQADVISLQRMCVSMLRVLHLKLVSKPTTCSKPTPVDRPTARYCPSVTKLAGKYLGRLSPKLYF